MLRWLKSELRRQQVGRAALPSHTALDSLRYVVLDTELTSLDSRSNRLLSIGAIAMDGPKIRLGEQFYRIVDPRVPVPPESVVIHQLRSEDSKGGEPLARTLQDLRRFVEGTVLVGHFLNIDLKVLWKELGGNRHELDNPAVDTARVHQWPKGDLAVFFQINFRIEGFYGANTGGEFCSILEALCVTGCIRLPAACSVCSLFSPCSSHLPLQFMHSPPPRLGGWKEQ